MSVDRVAALVAVVGGCLMAVAAFLVSPVAGMFVTGALLIAAGSSLSGGES